MLNERTDKQNRILNNINHKNLLSEFTLVHSKNKAETFTYFFRNKNVEPDETD